MLHTPCSSRDSQHFCKILPFYYISCIQLCLSLLCSVSESTILPSICFQPYLLINKPRWFIPNMAPSQWQLIAQVFLPFLIFFVLFLCKFCFVFFSSVLKFHSFLLLSTGCSAIFLTFGIWGCAGRSGALFTCTHDQMLALSYTGYLSRSRPAILEELRRRRCGCRAREENEKEEIQTICPIDHHREWEVFGK